MSREAARVRALWNAARLQHLLQHHDRVELLGQAIAKVESPAPAETGRGIPQRRAREMNG